VLGRGPVQPAVEDLAWARGFNWTTHRGPFQPLTFCDSVILCDSVSFCLVALDVFHCKGMNMRLVETLASGVNSVFYSITDYLSYLNPVS